MTGKSLMSGHKALQRKYEEAAASQSADLCDVKVFKRVFVQLGAGGYGSVSFSIDFKHYKGKAAQKHLSHTGRLVCMKIFLLIKTNPSGWLYLIVLNVWSWRVRNHPQ